MPVFKYKAKSQDGELKEGTMEAKNQIELARSLRDEGFFIIDAKQTDEKDASGSAIKKFAQFDVKQIVEKIRGVSLEERMMFSRNLAVMIESGIALTRALDVLEKQTQSPTFKRAIGTIGEDIKKGVSFSEAINNFPKIFDELYSNMIKVGEAAGNMDETLNILANQLEKEHELRSKIKGALTYPIIIVIAMVGIGILMMVTVVPQLEKVFLDIGLELPITTRSILLISHVMQKFWWLVLAAIPFAIWGITRFSGTLNGKKFFSWIFLHFPLFKSLTKKINNARFARNLSSLINGGVPIIEALNITSNTLGNYFYRESLGGSAKQVKKGESLFKVLANFPQLYTPLVLEMLEVGEEAGKLSDLLTRVAVFYEGEVSDMTDNMSSIIEPVLMLFIGAIVGFFAISVMQPIYGMLGSI